jgi:hypothetical protein
MDDQTRRVKRVGVQHDIDSTLSGDAREDQPGCIAVDKHFKQQPSRRLVAVYIQLAPVSVPVPVLPQLVPLIIEQSEIDEIREVGYVGNLQVGLSQLVVLLVLCGARGLIEA